MKNFKVLALIPLVALATACSSSNDGGNGNAANPQQPGTGNGVMMVEVSALGDESSERYETAGMLSFERKTNADPIYNEEMVYRVRNSSDEVIAFTTTVIGEGFAIVDTECGATLAAKSSCDVRVEFDGADHLNGMIRGAILFSATAPAGTIINPNPAPPTDNVVVLNLEGQLDISGNVEQEGPQDDGETDLSVVLPAAFVQGGDALRTVTITNSGDEAATALTVTASGAYSIFAHTCPSILLEGESCEVRVLYNNPSYLANNTPQGGSLVVDSAESETYTLQLPSTTVVESGGPQN